MQLKAAQSAMRATHVAGAPGVLASGIVWLVAGLVWQRSDITHAFAVLFFGGMAIMPASIFISRVILRAPKAAGDNPLDRLALEITCPLFAGLLFSYKLLYLNPSAVFPVMATIIGARYFSFRTIYDDVTYWILATALAVMGGSAFLGVLSWPVNLAVSAGIVEIVFAVFLFVRRDRPEL